MLDNQHAQFLGDAVIFLLILAFPIALILWVMYICGSFNPMRYKFIYRFWDMNKKKESPIFDEQEADIFQKGLEYYKRDNQLSFFTRLKVKEEG